MDDTGHMMAGGMTHITDDRMRHIRGVAEQAYRITCAIGYGASRAEEMYVLGFVHDVGYALGSADDHAEAGASVLERGGYELSEAVALHGEPEAELTSALAILNLADMTVDGRGRLVTLDERLDDIRERHGGDSDVARTCERLVERLRAEIPGIVIRTEKAILEGRDRESES